MKRLLPLVLVAIAFAACEKIIPISDDDEHLLVLNALPSADSTAFVYFAHTRFFLDSSYNQPVDGASLMLTVNGTAYAPARMERCNYFFPYQLQEGDELEIDATTPQGSVHAATYVPYFPQVELSQTQRFASSSFNFYIANLRLTDHADKAEYYTVSVSVRDSGARYNAWTAMLDTVDTIRVSTFLVPYTPEVTDSRVQAYAPLGGYIYSRLMFTDKLLTDAPTDIQLYIINMVDTTEVPPFKHEYLIDVASITPARWNYIVSASQQGGQNSFFAEQGEVWSNVEGALGIFAGMARRHFAFDPDTIQ